MEIVDASQEHNTGLELDKIDLSSARHAPESEEKVGKPGLKPNLKFKSVNVTKFKIALIIGGIALSLTFVYLLWGQIFINRTSMENTPAERMSERMATVGTVMSTFGKNEYIKMTVEIECNNIRSKDKVSELEQRIKDKIMLMLNDPKTRQKVRERNFDALKPVIKKEVERLLSDSGVEDVYFSQIIFY